MRVLRDKYDCKVPTTFEELLALPGVGRKSANLIMGDVFGKPAIVTDTHCIRLCNKIGLVDGIKEPQKVEMALWKIVPPEEGSDLCHRFVMHGRAVCNARKPECEKCCLKDICRFARETAGQSAKSFKIQEVEYYVWFYFQSTDRRSGWLHRWPHYGQRNFHRAQYRAGHSGRFCRQYRVRPDRSERYRHRG